jgi:hypothetical protein
VTIIIYARSCTETVTREDKNWNTVLVGVSQNFGSRLSLPCSGSKSRKESMNWRLAQFTVFLLGSFFYLENRGDIFFRNAVFLTSQGYRSGEHVVRNYHRDNSLMYCGSQFRYLNINFMYSFLPSGQYGGCQGSCRFQQISSQEIAT